MANIDPNIALGVKPLQIENPMNQYAAMSQIESNQQANQLNALKMQQAQQEIADVNALRGKDINDPNFISEVGKINPKLAFDYQTKQGAIIKDRIAAQESKIKLLSQMKRDISGRPSDANIIALTEDLKFSGLFSPQEVAAAEATQARLLAMPEPERKAFLASAGASASDLKPVIQNTNLGGTELTRAFDPYSGAATEISNINKTMTPGESAVDARAKERLKAEVDATGTLSLQAIDVAANIYIQTGQLPALGIGKNAGNIKSAILNRATQLYGNPNGGAAPTEGAPPATPTPFNASDMASTIVGNKIDNATKTKTNVAFATGPQSRQVTAFNTAIDHLGTMDKLADALNNNDVRAFNYLGNLVAKQTGQPAPTNFDAAKQIVTAEVIKAVVASGGGVKERQEAEANFSNASSPAQLKGVINSYKQLLGGQLNSLGLQYENGTGRTDFSKKLTPEARKEFEAVRGKTTESPSNLPLGVGANWTLMTDANGNKAYVNPANPKEYKEVK